VAITIMATDTMTPIMADGHPEKPIEESGGVNLYAFLGNDAVNRWRLSCKKCY